MKILLIVSFLLLVSSSFSFKLFSDIVEDDGFLGNTLTDSCSQARVSSVYSAIASCEQTGESSTTVCIINTLFNKTNQRWDVYAKASQVQAAVTYWYYSNCSIVLNNYGRYNRTYMIWAAENLSSQSSENTPAMSSAPSGDCSSDRVNSVNVALSSCQKSSENDSTDCILNMLRSNLTEYWDAFASRTSSASVQYWYYDQCSLNYYNYGAYNRTYTIWKTQ